jgi:hypothetical protein
MKWCLGVLLLAGCTASPSKPDANMMVMAECESRAECMGGKICSPDKRCVSCESSGQCSLKEVCSPDAGVCALREGWGAECTANESCQAGSWCKQGLCVARSQVSLCPQGLTTECPQGERCNRTTLVCEEDLGCSTRDDCGAMETCNAGSRQCVPRCTVEMQSSVCAAGERCVGDKCAQCADNADCGIGLVCDAAGRCVAGERCYTDRDCRVPLACFVATGACLPKPPPCVSNDNCPSDQRCDVRNGRCIARTCQPDRYEPNDSLMRAFAIVPSTLRDLTLCQGDVDWYGVTLQRGDQLGVNVEADPFSENTFSTTIRDSTQRTVASGRFLVSYVAPAAGKYYVVVSTLDPFQPYDVSFLQSRGIPCDDDALEPNDGPMQAVALNAQRSADGKVCPQDADWFQPQPAAGQGLVARLTNYNASRGLLRLCLVTVDGMQELACSDDAEPEVRASAAQVMMRPMLVRVTGSTERVNNAYTLEVAYP